MTKSMQIQQKYEFEVYPKRDVVLVKGSMAKVWDDNGREYIDCVGGHGVANIGHANPEVAEAIAAQAKLLVSCPGTFYNDQKALLLQKLISVAPEHLTRAFICNSGTEAIEAAFKFARFTTRKTDFLCAMRGFHGRTLGALSATYNPSYREAFEPLVPGFDFAPFNKVEKFAEKITDKTAAIVLEVIQGEGGVNIGDPVFFAEIQQLCREKGILLIIDEIQTGFCRTGRMFAIDHWGIKPDMLCVAKGLGGGFPIGAVLCSDKMQNPIGNHGSTFGGNPLACAAARASLDFMEHSQLANQACEKGLYFNERLKKIAKTCSRIREVRSLGLMVGIELKEKVKPYLIKLMDEGVLALPAGPTVLRLLPPLVIRREELDQVAVALEKVLK
jgi:acetylornithine/LysW-gamma-L-lysine aminotransferase